MTNPQNRVKQNSTTTGVGPFVLSAALPGFQRYPDVFPGGTIKIGAVIRNLSVPAEYVMGLGSLSSDGTQFSMDVIESSSNGGAAVSFSAGTKEIDCTLTAAQIAEFLTQDSIAALGTPVPDYLSGHPASAPSGTDVVAVVQGSSFLGMPLSTMAAFILGLFGTSKLAAVRVTTTTPFPLDFSTHNRRRIIFTAAGTINAPGSYSSVGDDFECTVTNVSGGVVTLGTGISGLPAGSTIANGSTARIFSTGGAIYAEMPTAASSGAVQPGQVTGLTLGTLTPSGMTATWTAPGTGTGPFTYTVQTSPAGANTWSTAGTSSTTSLAITGQSSSTSYDVRVSATNAAGTSASWSATATASTTAGLAAPGQVTGLAAGAPTNSAVPLSWSAPSSGGAVATYKVEYRLTSAGGAFTLFSGSITGLSSTVTGLAANTQYDFRTTGHNATNDGTPSSVITATTAAAAVAPFTCTARPNFPLSLSTFAANYMWHDVTPTGTATIVSITSALSTSNTVPPTSAISSSTSPQGAWGGPLDNYQGGTSYIADSPNSGGGITYPIPVAANFYFWIQIVDSDGATWNFCHAAPISIGNSVSATVTTIPTPTAQV